MGQHYTKATQSVAAYCKKCGKPTQHRVDGGRKGPCLECLARLDRKAAPSEAVQASASELWPMSCFCADHAFPHLHPDGFIRAHYPGPEART